MPKKVTVSDVRQELSCKFSREAEPGINATTGLLGRWFHEGVGFLLSPEPHPTPLTVMRESGDKLELWQNALKRMAFERFVGPRLTKQCASLQASGTQLLTFWEALQSACDWLAELSWAISPAGKRLNGPLPVPCQLLSDYVQTEVPLRCELREPGWSDTVELVGIADALLRISDTGMWCVVEFKTGQSIPQLDLAQAALYHLLLTRSTAGEGNEQRTRGDLALISFQPHKRETIIQSDQLRSTQRQLVELIGRVAGVSPVISGEKLNVSAAIPATPHSASTHPESQVSPWQDIARQIEAGFQEYGVTVRVSDEIVGPRFVRYRLILGSGVKVAAVERLTAELQVKLRLKAEPFVQRDDGQLVLDIERRPPQAVEFQGIRHLLPAPDPLLGSSILPVGVSLSGNLEYADLSRTEHAHILVAGMTGSGKSEWLRTAIAGLLLTNTPETLRLVLIDPKRNAFHALQGSPYLWEPVVFPDETPVVDVLRRLCIEMDSRYSRMNGVDNISQLAQRTGSPIPRIVCICDEYRDLISRSTKERKAIEAEICRLGAKARAAGIHLVLATQEPSRSTLTGAIDSNMPARVGLRLAKHLESQMLLQQSGAEKLLGDGDLLFKDTRPPLRLQAPYLNEEQRLQIYRRQE